MPNPPVDAPPTRAALDGAVFVDDTGRRARGWAALAAVLSLLLGTFVLALAVSVLTPGTGPRLHLPARPAPAAEPTGTPR